MEEERPWYPTGRWVLQGGEKQGEDVGAVCDWIPIDEPCECCAEPWKQGGSLTHNAPPGHVWSSAQDNNFTANGPKPEHC